MHVWMFVCGWVLVSVHACMTVSLCGLRVYHFVGYSHACVTHCTWGWGFVIIVSAQNAVLGISPVYR